MEEPRKEENQNTGEENQNQSGLPVRSCMLMCLAGIYLLYTGYKLCKNVIDGVIYRREKYSAGSSVRNVIEPKDLGMQSDCDDACNWDDKENNYD